MLDYPLNCKSVSFPEFTMGSSTVTFLNYSFDVSNRSNTTKKDLQISFLISENWLQYLMLLKWFELEDFTKYNSNREDTVTLDIGGVQQTVTNSEWQRYSTQNGLNPYYSTQGPSVNTTLYLMDNFMKRQVTFKFEGCWLKNIKNVELDYSKTSGTEVGCTFTLSYYKYSVYNNCEELKDFFPDGQYLDTHDQMINS